MTKNLNNIFLIISLITTVLWALPMRFLMGTYSPTFIGYVLFVLSAIVIPILFLIITFRVEINKRFRTKFFGRNLLIVIVLFVFWILRRNIFTY